MIETLLDQINRDLASNIKARFIVTLGDEFQGLVYPAFPFYEFHKRFFWKFAQNHPLRLGIGVGTIDTAFKEAAIGMDGPAFHAAREAIAQCKASQQVFRFQGFGADKALNALALTIQSIEAQWTDRQREVVELLDAQSEQASVARYVEISRQAINKILFGAQHPLYTCVWDGLEELLDRHF